jgi:hypothetical protein
MEKQKIRIQETFYDIYTAQKMIEAINAFCEPNNLKPEDVTIEISGDLESWDEWNYTLAGLREETDLETEARVKKEEAYKKAHEAKERETFERLKAKYGE